MPRIQFYIALLSTSVIASASPLRSDPDAFFKPGPTAPADKAADEVYPLGKLFPFSFFSIGGGTEEKTNNLFPEEIVQAEFEHYKTLDIPLFGPQYELNDRSLEDAEKHGLKVVYTVGLPMNFHDRTGEGGGRLDLTDEEIYEQVSAQVREVADNPVIAFWYLRPEELRPWRQREMDYLAAASRAVRDSDPKGRPLWIYDPNHAGANRLSAIAPHVDYVGKGMYANYASRREDRIWCRWTIEVQKEGIRRAESDAIPIAVPEMFRQPDDEHLDLIPAWVRHDSYLALVCGAKGMMVFSARRRPNFPARDAYYAEYAKIASELLGEMNLGQVFLYGERRDQIEIDVIDGPAEVELLYPSGGVREPISYPSVTHADIAYGDERYLFVVNSANDPVTVAVGGMPYHAVIAEPLFGSEDAFEIAEGEFELPLAPLEVKAYRMTRK